MKKGVEQGIQQGVGEQGYIKELKRLSQIIEKKALATKDKH